MSKPRDHKERFLKTPSYEGGIKAMRKFIRENMQYPKAALDAKLGGTVVVKYDIDYKGNVPTAKVISGIGHGCDEEAIRLVKLMKFSVPRNRKLKVVFHRSIQIHFRLPKVKATPKAKPKAPSQNIQYTYTTTSTKPVKKEEPPKKGGGYSYTIRF